MSFACIHNQPPKPDGYSIDGKSQWRLECDHCYYAATGDRGGGHLVAWYPWVLVPMPGYQTPEFYDRLPEFRGRAVKR